MAYAFNDDKSKEPIDDMITDTGWVDLTLSSNVEEYTTGGHNKPQYRRIGNVVYVKGTVLTKSSFFGSQRIGISTIPLELAPQYPTYMQIDIEQGTSGKIALDHSGNSETPPDLVAFPASDISVGTLIGFYFSYPIG